MATVAPQQNIRSADITLNNLLDLRDKQTKLTSFCHGVATVQSFDSGQGHSPKRAPTLTATMVYPRIKFQQQQNGDVVPVATPYPVLVDCPVIFPYGGSCGLTMPIQQGDTCVIMFNDRDLDNWFSSGQPNQPPNSARLHSFTDAMAFVGVRALPDATPSWDSARATLFCDLLRVAAGASGLLVTRDPTNTITLGSIIRIMLTAMGSATTAAQIAAAATAALTALNTNGLLE